MIIRVCERVPSWPPEGSVLVATRQELLSVGWSRRAIESACRAGTLQRQSRSLVGASPGESPEERWLHSLAVLVARTRPDGVVAGTAAACLYGLDGFDMAQPLRVDVPAQRRFTAVPHIQRTRDPAQSVAVGMFPVTSVARTLADIGDRLEPQSRWRDDVHPIPPVDLIELAVDCALRQGLVTMDQLTVTARSRRPGAKLLCQVLARRPVGTPPTESHLETRFVQMNRSAGLPEPDRQVEIHDRFGTFIGRVDFALGRLLVECDSRKFHGGDAAFMKDRDRWNRLQAEGYWPMVLTSEHIERSPARTVDLIRRTQEHL